MLSICFFRKIVVLQTNQTIYEALLGPFLYSTNNLCPPQTNRRDETRRVSTMSVSSADVRGPVFASFLKFSFVGGFPNGPRTPADATKRDWKLSYD